jgi:rubrerythrin
MSDNTAQEETMKVEEVFGKALEYETRIRDQYAVAAKEAKAPEARAFYEALGKDEESHVAYINHKLKQWQSTGAMDAKGLTTIIPDRVTIDKAVDKAKASFSAGPEGGHMAALENALRAEEETSAFYRSMVDQLPAGAKDVFARLLEIEEGHTAIVRAELDMVSNTGHWFDIREFDME